MKITIYCCLLISAIIAGGCYSAPVKPPGGILFTSYKAPLTADFKHTVNDSELIKTSHKKTQYFMEPLLTAGILEVAWGEVDIEEIATKASITTVAYAYCELLNVLGLYSQFTVNVYGYVDSELRIQAKYIKQFTISIRYSC